jgi:hypothetical protein
MGFWDKSGELSRYRRFIVLKRIAILVALGTPFLAQLVVMVSQPYATRGVDCTGQGIAEGGTPHYNFTITQRTLPPGLQIDGTNAITGSLTRAGSDIFKLSAGDSLNTGGYGTASPALTK